MLDYQSGPGRLGRSGAYPGRSRRIDVTQDSVAKQRHGNCVGDLFPAAKAEVSLLTNLVL